MGEPRTVISINEACRNYQMGQVQVRALRSLSLDIREGEFLVIVGPSGSGKSTLLNLIGGMDRPSSGTVRSFGHELTSATDEELTEYRRQEVGFIFQFYNLIPTLTAIENVQVAAELAENPIAAMHALAHVDLAQRASHFPSQLSGGEQQRVAIARAIVSQPKLLLCDEPTGALDLETSKLVLTLLRELNRRLSTTLVLITHNGAIAQIGDRVAHMRDGALRDVRINQNPVHIDTIAW